MGYASWYESVSRPFRSVQARRALSVADRALVFAFAASYLVLVALLVVQKDPRLFKAITVPAATFILVTAVRAGINRPRPYEAAQIDPLIVKDTRGKSLPSRHMASAVIIASTYLWVYPVWGVVLISGCACIAFTRIVGGVHYPTDIAVAWVASLACALVGFVLT